MADTHDWLIVLTDGMWETQSRAIESAAEVASAGADIMAIGFGSADRSFLKKIATRDDFAAMTELSHLRETFSTIGRAMASGNALRAY